MFNSEPHPFVQEIGAGTPSYHILPPQIIPLKDKVSKKNGEASDWAKATLDSLSFIGRSQFLQKRRLKNNYQLAEGLPSDDTIINTETEEYDLLEEVSDDLPLPKTVNHYDLISQPINTLVGELIALPDLFLVEGKGERFTSDKLKIKSLLLEKWFRSQVEIQILESLLKEGINPEAELLEEEQSYVQERIEQLRQELTPQDIQRYITNDFRHNVELWAEEELKDQVRRFNLKKQQRIEFRDYLIAAERARLIYKDSFGLKTETLNPLFVFTHKSPEIEYFQDGNYGGIIRFLSISTLIDKYGHYMSSDQIESLQKSWKAYYREYNKGKDMFGNKIDYLSPSGLPYQTYFPSLDRAFLQYMPSMAASGNALLGILEPDILAQVDGFGENPMVNTYGMLVVYECYWKTQIRLSKVRWINPKTGLDETIVVDETFDIPKWVQEIKDPVSNLRFKDEELPINSVIHTWVNQTWKGIKVDNYFTNGVLTKPMYLGVGANELQFKGELHIYDCKLPIAGQYANHRNVKPMSLVDKLSNLNKLYNLFMNQVYHYVQTELLPFLVMERSIMPKDKDWGGDDALEKWINIAQELGLTLADNSYQNTQGAPVQGGQLPREINLDRSQRIMLRWQLAQGVKQLSLEQIGIFPQRLGDVKSTETATGVQEATSRSYTQTSSWFESFFDCEREILQMQIDAAQYLQSQNLDLGKSIIQSDFTQKLLELNGNDFNLYQLHIYVMKSQEEQRKLQIAQQLAQMNTTPTPMSDRIVMSTSTDVKEIIKLLKDTEKEQAQQLQQQNQLEQQKLQQVQEIEAAKLQKQDEQFYAQLQNNLDVASIRSSNNVQESNDVSGLIDTGKLQLQQESINNQAKANKDKSTLERDKFNQQQIAANSELEDKAKQRQHEQILADKEIIRTKIQGDKSK